MKKLMLLLAAGLAFGTVLAGAAPVLQIRLVLDAPTADSEVLSITSPAANGETHSIDLNVQDTVLLDESSIKSAKEVVRKFKLATGQELEIPEIEIKFTSAGKQLFAQVTGQNIGKKLAILINGRVYCAPTIRAALTTGKAEITGSFTEAEAKALAADIDAVCAK
jgi:preprotein translocase subunit SecD